MSEKNRTNILNLSPERKLRLALDLYHSARQLKRAALIREHPDWPEEKIEKRLRDIFLHARS